MKFIGLSFFVLVATAFLGEAVLILGYFAMAIAAWFWFRRRWISGSITGLCLIAFLLHINGFKLYGKPVLIAEKESLKNPRTVVALEPPAKVIFADGESIELSGIFFPKSVNLLQGTTNVHDVFQDAAGIHVELRHDSYHQEQVEVEVQKLGTNGAKAICLRRALYWCGNTWFPHFFPKGLPQRLREDFDVVLVRAGIALPTLEHVQKAPEYWDPLMKALTRGYFHNIPAHHPDVIRLGHFLVESRPNEFNVGVELLIQAEDTASNPKLAAEIRRRRLNSSVEGAEVDWQLVALDQEEAPRIMRNLEMQANPDPLNAVGIAGILSQRGDWSGFDFLTKLLTKPELETDYRKSLGTQLTSPFHFKLGSIIGWGTPEKVSELFPEWYAENRDRLRWVKQPNGEAGFALITGSVFDEAYYKTMESYRARFQPNQQ
ncbi:MAG: hypothetical protein ABIP71_06055 [Verrucomicrobiota bacterium]